MTDAATERRVYQTAVFDSTRWEGFRARPDDIFICTPPKCGTTWTQTIVASLLWPDGGQPAAIWDMSPWLEARFEPIDDVLARLEAQAHRRFIKSHTPPDGLPWFPGTSYVAVLRDGRDAMMSLVNHIEHFRPEVRARLDEQARENHLPAMREYDGDVRAFFASWLQDEPVFFPHASGWWERRHLPNVLLVHYNDLKADLDGEMARIARFLGIEVAPDLWPQVVERCTFESMKQRGRRGEIGDFEQTWHGGSDTFLHKGTNERWRGVLTSDDLDAYERVVGERLPPDAAEWVEKGSIATGVRPEAR